MVKRGGFSLIELILSVLVVAIVSASLPLAVRTTSNLSEQSLMQEGLMNAKTYMSLILKAPFSDQVLIAGKNTMPSSITTQEAIIFPLIICDQGANPDFYEKSGVKGEGHRILAYPVQNSSACATRPNDSKLPESIKSVNFKVKSIKNFNTQKSILPTASTTKRDFIIDTETTPTITNGADKFVVSTPLNDNDVLQIKLDTTMKTTKESKSVLFGYAFNIGESSTLSVKEWK